MNTEQLNYFLSAARHKSFTEAAREFYITQPAITHQISALENELGARLFTRNARGVSLTRAGELFLEDAKRLLDQEARARERLRQLELPDKLELKIGYLNSPCRHFLPQIVSAFQRAYPQVRLSLLRRDAAGVQAGAEQGEFDLCFTVLSDLTGLSGYDSRKLATDHYCLVCPKDHPCLHNRKIDYNKLATEPFACMSREVGAFMYKQFMQICRELGFTPNVAEEAATMEDVIFSVECGQTLAILPYHVRAYMHTDLAFVPLDGPNPAIDVGVAWRRQSDNRAVGWFMDLVNHFLVEQPDLF